MKQQNEGKKKRTEAAAIGSEQTEVVFILDRSGSMSGLESDTIGGYNSMLKKQTEEPGTAWITTVLFDDRVELLHDRIPLAEMLPITDKEYYVRGSTALLDAIGYSIQKVSLSQKLAPAKARASRILFVITTDGYENASREYSYDKIRNLILEKKQKDGWEFLFLGANIDAVAEAAKFGIERDRAVKFTNSSRGVNLNYAVVSDVVSNYRQGNLITKDWKDSIETDED